MEYFIKKANIEVNENICIICLEKIPFEKKHYLHCGHFFHCECINKWIGMDKSRWPTCKQNIDCCKSFSDDSLDEEEDNNNNENNEFTNRRVVQTTNYSLDYFELLIFYFWILIIFFMFRGFYLSP